MQRYKSRLIPVLLLVALLALGVFFYATTAVISQAFNKVEDQNITTNTARAVDALSDRIDQLAFKATDWASWDDTYAFMAKPNPAYIKSNLGTGSLDNLGIHYMLFMSPAGAVVEDKAISSATGADIDPPAELKAAFQPGSPFLATGPESAHRGLLALSDRTVQFVALPILTSDGAGPYHGTLVFASDVTPDEIAGLSQLTHNKLQFYRLRDPARPADVKQAVGDGAKTRTAITRASDTLIVGYQVVPDAYAKPALVARVERPRDIHQTASSAITKYLLIIVLASALAVAFVFGLLQLIKGRDRTIALKNEFFSIASHELRTPLTVIRDYAQLMKFQFSHTVNDPKFDHMADQIDQAGAQLIGVVNVYLDAARLESGKIPFQPQPFAMADIAKSVGPQLQANGQSKNITVTLDMPETLPKVMGDKERVQQIVLNLFGNAMKFTDQGTIAIKAEVKGSDKLMCYCTDSGRGMDEAAQKKLFQRFSQVQSKDALRGSGLGLFISKKLIEQMGGSIQVESSAPGIGTTISFSLPLAPATPAAAPAPAAPAPSPGAPIT